TYPRAYRAGWGYMLLTNFLPNQGNGTFTLHAIAYDGSGHRVELGQKGIICDNAGRVKPFGTIDTPGQGQTISGSGYVNFGWALTPLPKMIPLDGSTIWVWVDSVPLGNPDYNHYRSDIAALFPGYLNSDGAVGFYILDTTAYLNGVHNIAWSVTDDDGAVDGIGSRFFEIQNLGGGALGSIIPAADRQMLEDPSGGLRIELVEVRDFAREKMPQPQELVIEELGRIEIHFQARGGGAFMGWGENERKPLPVGSTLDRANGIFYWIPGPGFLGRHVLHFAVTDGVYRSKPVTIVVNIKPKKYLKY
ncbi:MAG: hypothetical protein JRE58_12765, partial [Deltaproteobacteria bacterium]|nr:hypothetical protein [Deltaproteobacteria bacterium]